MTLIDQIRQRGWPHYAEHIPEQVHKRTAKLYGKYKSRWQDGFVPEKVRACVDLKTSDGSAVADSIVPEKITCPAEEGFSENDVFRGVRPLELVAERSAAGISDVHEHQRSLYGK